MLVDKAACGLSSSTPTARQFARHLLALCWPAAQLKQSLLLTKKAFCSSGVEISLH